MARFIHLMKGLVVALTVAIIAMVWAVIIIPWALNLPVLRDRHRGFALEGQCRHVKQGMSPGQVEELIYREAKPYRERYDGTRMSFESASGACEIELDAETATVVKATFLRGAMADEFF